LVKTTNSDFLLKRKNYLEKQLDLFSEDSFKSSEILSELQSIEHKLKYNYIGKKRD
jgi:hypothetical protein